MKFHYEFDISKLPDPITHQKKIMLIGSCFTEHMGEKFRKYKFRVLENPNGILFNPVSVAECLINLIEKRKYTETDLFQFNEGWHSWQHHSRFSGMQIQDVLEKINASVHNGHDFLKHTDYLVITLGSSWIYTLTEKAELSKPGMVAANNHKAPSDWFHRKLMQPEEVLSVMNQLIHRILLFNPDIRILFTISPVRHLREGVIANNRSKAVLIQAVHHLVEKFKNLYYFPAYEIVIDDLRDYRFYSEDLVHPNYFATEYVWEKLVASCMNENTRALMEEIHAINLAFRHKPFQESSAQHKKFLESFLQKTKLLLEKYPYLDFEKELEYFDKGIRE